MLASGDIVCVKVPSHFRAPFDIYTTAWKQWAKSVDGQQVKLVSPRTVSTGGSQNAENGWDVESRIGFYVQWLPTEWLELASGIRANLPKNSKIPCNCPLNQILSTGCKQPDHV